VSSAEKRIDKIAQLFGLSCITRPLRPPDYLPLPINQKNIDVFLSRNGQGSAKWPFIQVKRYGSSAGFWIFKAGTHPGIDEPPSDGILTGNRRQFIIFQSRVKALEQVGSREPGVYHELLFPLEGHKNQVEVAFEISRKVEFLSVEIRPARFRKLDDFIFFQPFKP
jgi:hypothetical protein